MALAITEMAKACGCRFVVILAAMGLFVWVAMRFCAAVKSRSDISGGWKVLNSLIPTKNQ